MAKHHPVADDIVYNLISIQYHALQGAETYDQYLEDAHSADHPDVTEFIRQCRDQDNDRALRCHELLRELTKEGGIG
jgi:uncharacterized short protein YbdD (DUF466 family)